MKRILIILLPLILTACTHTTTAETQTLHDKAIVDAKRQPKSIHLAYLKCYALQEAAKISCIRVIRDSISDINDMASWEYIHPFDYEAEKLGFAAFLRDHGKVCQHINDGPQYDRTKQVYDVRCSDNYHYSMRFNYKNNVWLIAD